MIRSVIIDDEAKARNFLQKIISDYCENIEVVGTADTIKSGIKVINETDPDLVFLDINLPYGSGFDLLKQLESIRFDVIFTTAFSDYALKAIKHSAIDYLLKPIDIEELKQAVDKCIKKKDAPSVNERFEEALHQLEHLNHDQKKIILPTFDGLILVDVNDIIRCEASGSYTEVKMVRNEKMVVSKTLKEIDGLLSGSTFFRVHKSHLINLRHMKRYFKGKGGMVLMSDGHEVEVAVRKKEGFLKALGNL